MRPAASTATWSGRGDFSVPLGGATAGRLVFATGASRLEVVAGTALDELCRARFGGAAPDVRVLDGTVTIGYRRQGLERILDWGGFSARVELGPAVPWAIEVRGGMSKLTADLRRLHLAGLEFRGGASEVDVALPVPAGTVPLRVSGGASKIAIHRPSGVPVRLTVSGGYSTLTLDGRRVDRGDGSAPAETPGFREATDRYEIVISGGASKIGVDSR